MQVNHLFSPGENRRHSSRRTFARSLALAFVLVLALGPAMPAFAAPAVAAGGKVASYIVVLKDGVEPEQAAGTLARQYGLALGHVYQHAMRGFSAKLPPALAAALARDPRIAFIEPDLEMTITAELRTGVDRVDADLHPLFAAGKNVDVDIAILDTGIDPTHPDLNVVGGVSFVPGVSSYADDHGHGTHVAGIAAAKYDGKGVVGVAPGARLWAVKVLSSSGSGSMSDIIKGIDWVTQRAATIEVANMSLGAVGRSDSLRAALQRAVGAGVVFVVAAGNSSRDVYGPDGAFGTTDDFIPAAYPEVASISAMADTDGTPGGRGSSSGAGPDDTMATFSNYGRNTVSTNPVKSPGGPIDVAAPGVGIYSTWMRGGYSTASGTSMAAPHAAGVYALYMAQNNLKPSNAAAVYAIRQAIIDGGQPQSQWRTDGNTRDPDGNREPMAYAGSMTSPSQPPPPAPPAPTYGVSVSPASRTGQALAGASATYSYTITNTGSVAATFAVSTSSAWQSSASPASMSLAAGAATLVTVTHVVPASAAAGTSDAGTLRVSSNTSGSTVSATGSFTTTVQAPTQQPPPVANELNVAIRLTGTPRPGSIVELIVTVTDSEGRAVPSAQVALSFRTATHLYSGTRTTDSAGVVRVWVWTATNDYFPWTIKADASKNGVTGSRTITYPSP